MFCFLCNVLQIIVFLFVPVFVLTDGHPFRTACMPRCSLGNKCRRSTGVNQWVLCWVCVAYLFSCLWSLRSEFHVVMSFTMSASKRCSVLLYLQLFVGGLMSYLRHLCLVAYIGVQHIFGFSSSYVPYVSSFSGLSICYSPLVFSGVY